MNYCPKVAVLALVSCLAISGCNEAGSHSHALTQRSVETFSGEYPIDVLCTTGHVAEMVERVGGTHVEVNTLMGPGVDPHLYKPLSADVDRLSQAEVIFYSGLHLEGRLADLFVRRARTHPTYAVTEGIQLREDKRLREPPEFEGMYDPHVWHDVSLWAECVRDVAEMLAKLDPAHADDYQANAESYIDELGKLHQYCRDEIAKLPAARRVLVTAHDAFGYFGKAYGIEVVGLKGISSEEEKDLAHQEEVQKMLIERKIPAVFVESTINDRTIKALIEPCRAAGWDLKQGGTLYSDALGEAGTDAGTYTGMIRHNVQTIVQALAVE